MSMSMDRGGDEMNLIEPSLNHGWPAITYGIDYSGAVISPFTENGIVPLLIDAFNCSIRYFTMAIYIQLKNSLVTALVSQDVKKVTFAADGKDVQESLFSELNSRLRNIEASPNGLIYLLDGPKGKLIKVLPEEL